VNTAFRKNNMFAFTTISILLISGTFLFNSAIGFGPGTLDQENLKIPGSAMSISIGSNFGFQNGQQYMQTGSNLHSVDILFHNPPGATLKTTPVKVCIYQSPNANFKMNPPLGCVTKNVIEGPGLTDFDPTTPGTQFVENFEFSPNIPQTPGIIYVINVEEDRSSPNSNTQIFWLFGLPYNPGSAVPDESHLANNFIHTDDVAFRTYNEQSSQQCPPGTAGIFPDCTSVIGGKIIPIESASLLLAGAQSFSWMIPVVLSVLGIGLFVVSRKTENS